MDNTTYASPICYVGGKKWLYKHLSPYIPLNTKAVVEPFFGGGAIGFNLAYHRGVKVYGYDIDADVVNFYQHWLANPQYIVDNAKVLLETHTHADFVRMQKEYDSIKGAKNRAAVLYLLTQLGFGGKWRNGGVLQVSCENGVWLKRHNDTGWRPVLKTYGMGENLALETYPKLPVSVNCADFQTALSKHHSTLAYCDPPYVGTETYYKKSENEFEHQRLANTLHNRDEWILSYADCGLVRDLYRSYPKVKIETRHSINAGDKRVVELLIFSHDLSPNPEYKQMYLF